MTSRFLTAALAVALAASTACSSSPEAPPDGSSWFDANVCVVPLASIACASTYETAGDRSCQICGGWENGCPRTGLCNNNTLFYVESDGYGGNTCFYDMTTRQLIGGSGSSDYPQYCNGQSFSAQAGLDAIQCDNAPGPQTGAPYCPDQDGGTGD